MHSFGPIKILPIQIDDTPALIIVITDHHNSLVCASCGPVWNGSNACSDDASREAVAHALGHSLKG